MKVIVLFLLVGIILSYTPNKAVSYAKSYCRDYNPKYNNYNYKGGDCANFVSQCLTAGGQKFDGCKGKDDKGMIPKDGDLKSCLMSKGWKLSTTKPPKFKAGYPIFEKSFGRAAIATGVDGKTIIYCDHYGDVCDGKLLASYFNYLYL